MSIPRAPRTRQCTSRLNQFQGSHDGGTGFSLWVLVSFQGDAKIDGSTKGNPHSRHDAREREHLLTVAHWIRLDVIKLESRGRRHARLASRHASAVYLYFTMWNCKQALDRSQHEIARRQGRQLRRAAEEERHPHGELPGPACHWFLWEKVRDVTSSWNPSRASSGPYADFKAYENVAGMGGAMKHHRRKVLLVTGAQIGDSGTGPAPRHPGYSPRSSIVTDLRRYVEVAMMDGVMNLCREVARSPAPHA